MLSKNIVILGAGESGVGAAVLAKKKGYNVFVSDSGCIKAKYKEVLLSHEIKFEENKHSQSLIIEADEVIKSPGIPDKASIVQLIKDKGISIIDELEFAARFTKAKKICITGSNGKTTTTLLTYHILKNAEYNVGLAGNVGKSFAMQVANDNYDYYVIEISSFQLDYMFDFKADIAILCNITPDHLDRYGYNFNNYVNSKFKILNNQTIEDSFIYCSDDLVITTEIEKRNIISCTYPISIQKEMTGNGAYLQGNEIIVNTNSNNINMNIETLALQGKHNIYNSMAAGVASRILGIRKDVIKNSLSDFQNVSHRLEFVANVHGVEYINDSKATNVNSTWYALECMTKPTIWIVGGQDKGNDYTSLKYLVKSKVKAIICLGKDNEKIFQEFGSLVSIIVETQNAKEAVEKAYSLSQTGDVVLLSPTCASFDLFENYEDRGDKFKAAINEL